MTSQVACPVCFFSFLSFDFQTSRTSARNIELTSEESLIYVNLWLLVCQVADQRQFTVGAERAFKSSDAFLFFFFKSRLGSHAAEHHPPLWMFDSAIQLQCTNRWQSWQVMTCDCWAYPCTWVFFARTREGDAVDGQLMFLWAKAIQLLSCVFSPCVCV